MCLYESMKKLKLPRSWCNCYKKAPSPKNRLSASIWENAIEDLTDENETFLTTYEWAYSKFGFWIKPNSCCLKFGSLTSSVTVFMVSWSVLFTTATPIETDHMASLLNALLHWCSICWLLVTHPYTRIQKETAKGMHLPLELWSQYTRSRFSSYHN